MGLQALAHGARDRVRERPGAGAGIEEPGLVGAAHRTPHEGVADELEHRLGLDLPAHQVHGYPLQRTVPDLLVVGQHEMPRDAGPEAFGDPMPQVMELPGPEEPCAQGPAQAFQPLAPGQVGQAVLEGIGDRHDAFPGAMTDPHPALVADVIHREGLEMAHGPGVAAVVGVRADVPGMRAAAEGAAEPAGLLAGLQDDAVHAPLLEEASDLEPGEPAAQHRDPHESGALRNPDSGPIDLRSRSSEWPGTT